MDQGAVALWLVGVQRLLQGIQDEVRGHRWTHAPTHDAPGKDIHDESHIQPALPSRDIGEVRDPQLIGTIGTELPVHIAQRTRHLVVADGGAHRLASPDPM